MREIKFRGKRLDNGAWVEGHYFKTPLTAEFDVAPENGAFFDSMRETPRYCISDENGVVFEVDPATVGQYTGLKDKNGKEVYEGDILLLSDKKSHSEDVVVEHGLYGWTFFNPRTATFYSDGSHTYVAIENHRFMFGTGAIIGNIHDDSELLRIEND